MCKTGHLIFTYDNMYCSTFSELFEGERRLDVVHSGSLEGLGVVGHDVGLEGVDKVAHDMDEDPVTADPMLF